VGAGRLVCRKWTPEGRIVCARTNAYQIKMTTAIIMVAMMIITSIIVKITVML
jgi:hypothetical protein